MGRERRKHHLVAVTVVMMIGAGLRLFQLGEQSLWLDELFSVFVARQEWRAVIQATAQGDTNPPLFNLLLHVALLFGDSEQIVRAVSAVFSFATLPLFYRLARELFDPRVALVALALLALNPFHILFAQEARMYAQLTFFVVASFLFFWRALHIGRTRHWLLFTLSMALALYSHSLAFLNLLALDLFAMLQWKTDRGRYWPLALSHLGILALFVPWLVVWLGQVDSVRAGFWVDPPPFTELLTTVYLFLFGPATPAMLVPLALFLAIALLAIIPLALRRARYTQPETAKSLLFAALVFLLPPLLLYFVSLHFPIFVARTLLPASLGLLLLLAWLFARAYPRQLHLVFATILLAMTLVTLGNYYFEPAVQKPQMRQAAQALEMMFEEGDSVIHTSDSSALAFMYYAPQVTHDFLAGDPDYVVETTRGQSGRVAGLTPVGRERAVAGHERVWLVVALDHNVDYQRERVEEFDALYTRRQHETVGKIDLLLYEID